jgi:DNA polymerase-3 subunit delta'
MASLMSQVIGHEEQKYMLQSAIENQSLPHAMVFSGPAGIGKMKLAQALAQSLV